MMTKYEISFSVPYTDIQSLKFHPLSAEGPYLDAHFGNLDNNTPVGQTYYIRPVVSYTPPCKKGLARGCGCGGKGGGSMVIKSRKCFPSVHANANVVSEDFAVSGVIKIQPFEWVKGNATVLPDQIVTANLSVYNSTGKTLQGFHIHDGQRKGGLVGFGPVSYFLYTTPTWNRRYNSKASDRTIAPLPLHNITPAHPKRLLNLQKESQRQGEKNKAGRK